MRQKIKNAILLTLTKIAALALMISVCCVDSESLIPIYVFLASLAWLALFAKANEENAEEILRKWRLL